MGGLTCKEDLDFVYGKLLKHPLFAVQPERYPEFEALYDAVMEKQNGFEDLPDAMTSLTGFFEDGHTNIELPYTSLDKCLNIPCCWSGERLLLSKEFENMEKGAQIVSVEGMRIDDLISFMAGRIPHENIYLVKSRMVHYPYKNYHVFSQMNLKAMFGKKERFRICFYRSGKLIQKDCCLRNYDHFLDFEDEASFLSYEVTDETATLHLNACICNEVYKKTLDELAELCEKRKIRSFVLDLSRNMGGSSSVIDEFIKRVDIDEYRRYEMIDYSQGSAEYITRRQEAVKNQKSAKCLPSDICCRVSCDTFSSARTFAVTLSDNGIAKIIGTPTGGKPNSFGMPQRYRTPNFGIAFRVSRCLFLRPDPSGDHDISLFPNA